MDARLVIGLGALVVALAVPQPSASRCTPVDREWLRSDSGGHVVATLQADSALAALWRPDSALYSPLPDSARERQRRILFERGQAVYGQWATVERGTSLPVGSRVLVVNWGLGSLCKPIPTGRAYVQPAGTRIYIGAPARLDSTTASGAPVIHLRLFTNWYIARARNLPPGVTALSVDEYEMLQRAMPTRSEWRDNPERAAGQIRHWIRTNESLARRYPALYYLEEVEEDLRWEQEWRARKP